MAAQPEEAVELYLAADRPRQALAILGQQLSVLLPQAAEEVATGMAVTGEDCFKLCHHRIMESRCQFHESEWWLHFVYRYACDAVCPSALAAVALRAEVVPEESKAFGAAPCPLSFLLTIKKGGAQWWQ